MTTLDRLVALAPPPPDPLDPGRPERWPSIERELGTALPADYKHLIEVYGTGHFDDFLYLYTPFAADPDANLLMRMGEILDAYRWRREQFPSQLPLPPFPEPGGLLPLGATGNGDQLFWLTGGDPDQWPVIVFGSRDTEHERHEGGVVAFLTRLLDGELRTGVFPDDLPDDGHEFEPG